MSLYAVRSEVYRDVDYVTFYILDAPPNLENRHNGGHLVALVESTWRPGNGSTPGDWEHSVILLAGAVRVEDALDAVETLINKEQKR